MQGRDDTVGLHSDESEVFGNTDHFSPVTVRVRYDQGAFEKAIRSDLKKTENLNSYFDKQNRRIRGPNAGIAYLMFSAISNNRSYIAPGFSFEVILTSQDEQSFFYAIQSFWLLVFFGGIGLRSRRGAGQIRIISFAPEQLPGNLNLICPAKTAAQLKEFLYNSLQQLNCSGNSTRYTTLRGAQIDILNRSFTTWIEALNEIGRIYEAYRFDNRGDIFQGPHFGFPVMHGKRGMKGVLNGQPVERRSSPLLFKTWSCGNVYFAGFIHMHGDLLPPGGRLGMDGKGNGQINPNVVEEFLHMIENKLTLTVP
jgi:CRISPR-associated protein Cmr1